MRRFSLAKHPARDGYWVVMDVANGIAIDFAEHEYNDTQQVTILDDSPLQKLPPQKMASGIATAMREIAEYLFTHWYSIALPTPPFEFRKDDENDRLLLIRNKFPRFTAEIQDDCTVEQISAALKNAGEFARKMARRMGNVE